MVKPNIFAIVFDNPNRVYQPGECVAGHIDLEVSKEMRTNGIYLTVYGGALTDWIEKIRKGKHVRRYDYGSEEDFINTTLLVWGNDSTQIVPPGRYSLPFSVPLPEVCLPSFQGSKGRIQYYCEAKFDQPGRSDHKVKEMFTVLPVYDLNLNPITAIGLSSDEAMPIDGCCRLVGTAFFGLEIPKGGFVPGECIRATVHIDNQSTRPIEAVEIRLSQVVRYTGVKEDSEKLLTRTDIREVSNAVESLKEKQAPFKYSLTKDIPIPPVVPTMGKNSIIEVNYELDCILDAISLSVHLEVPLPIIIGTTPLLLPPTAPPFSIRNYSTSDPSLPALSLPSAPTEPPPPSYEECMFGKMDARGKDDNEYTGGDFEYAPKYPVYRF